MNTLMRNQQGVALILVLVILALVTLIATQMVSMRGLYSHRTQNMILADNAWGYAVGAETLAKIALNQSLKNEDNVHLGQPWASQSVVFPIEGGQLSASLKDLKGCFNVNMVATVPTSGNDNQDNQNPVNNDKATPGQQIFTRMLQLMPLELEQQPDFPALAARLRDWIDSNQLPTGFEGREDEEYSGYLQPYRTADQLLVSSSELRTISGFEPDLIAQLMPYVCVIPNHQDITINVNTIDADKPELLASFYTNLSLDQARNILSARPADGFDQDNFGPLVPADATLVKGAGIVFDSNHFAALIEVQLGNTKTRLKSLFEYDKSGSAVQLLARLGHND